MDRHRVEQLRRSAAMAAPESLVLNREDSLALLARLYLLEALVDELRARIASLDA